MNLRSDLAWNHFFLCFFSFFFFFSSARRIEPSNQTLNQDPRNSSPRESISTPALNYGVFTRRASRVKTTTLLNIKYIHSPILASHKIVPVQSRRDFLVMREIFDWAFHDLPFTWTRTTNPWNHLLRAKIRANAAPAVRIPRVPRQRKEKKNEKKNKSNFPSTSSRGRETLNVFSRDNFTKDWRDATLCWKTVHRRSNESQRDVEKRNIEGEPR